MHIAGKYERPFELKERVDARIFKNQAYEANRNRSKLLQGQSMHYGQPNGLFFSCENLVESCRNNAYDMNCRAGKINVELFCVMDRLGLTVRK